jgi:hypothetical protein
MAGRIVCAATLALAASVNAGDFFWKHDTYWHTDGNWDGGKAPGINAEAVLRVDECEIGTKEITIADGHDEKLVSIEIFEGVNLIIEDGAKLTLEPTEKTNFGPNFGGNSSTAPTEPTAQLNHTNATWRCKSREEVDMRCGKNWATDGFDGDASGLVPCLEDTVKFTSSSQVETSGLPFFRSVEIGGARYTQLSIRDAASHYSKQFSAPFMVDRGSTQLTTEFDITTASMDCYDTCIPEGEGYNETLSTIVEERTFIEDNLAGAENGVLPTKANPSTKVVEHKSLLLSVVTNLPDVSTLDYASAYESMLDLSTVNKGSTKSYEELKAFFAGIADSLGQRFNDQDVDLGFKYVFQQGNGGAAEFQFKNCRAVANDVQGWSEAELGWAEQLGAADADSGYMPIGKEKYTGKSLSMCAPGSNLVDTRDSPMAGKTCRELNDYIITSPFEENPEDLEDCGKECARRACCTQLDVKMVACDWQLGNQYDETYYQGIGQANC